MQKPVESVPVVVEAAPEPEAEPVISDIKKIDLVDRNNAEIQKLISARAETLTEQQRFERKVIIQASESAKNSDWGAAVAAYENGLKSYPNSNIMRDGLAKAYTGREQTASGLETELLVSRGKWLANSLPLYEQLAKLEPTALSAKLKLNIWSSEAKRVAKDLEERGKRALLESDLKTAELTLTLAQQLDPEMSLSGSLTELNQRKARIESRKQQAVAAVEKTRQQEETRRKEEVERKKHDEYMALRNAFDQAYRNNNLVESQKLLVQLEAFPEHERDAKKVRIDLNRSIEAEVQRLLDQGVLHYSKSEFEKALVSWRSALVLDPDNQQISTNIERAQRVIDNLNKLKVKQE